MANSLTSFSLNMNTGAVTLNFDSAVSSLNLQSIRLVSSPVTPALSIPLTGSTVVTTLPASTITVALSNRILTQIKSQNSYFVNTLTTILTIEVDATTPGPTTRSASYPTSYVTDISPPQLLSFSYQSGSSAQWNLSLTFDEPVQVSTFQPQFITLQSTGSGGSTRTLLGGSFSTSPAFSSTIYLTLTPTDLPLVNAICTSASNTYMSIAPQLVKDWNDNNVVAVSSGTALQASSYTAGGAPAGYPMANTTDLRIAGGSGGQLLSTDGNGNLTWATVATSGLSNGTSNIDIPLVNGNVTISSAGNANILTVTGTGANITGTANITGNANVGNLGATGIVATGNANITGTANVGNASVNANLFVGGNANLGITTVNGNLTVNNVATFVNTVTLGNVANVKITGGNANQYLQTDGNGNVTWANAGGGTLTSITAGAGLSGGNITTTGTIALLPPTGGNLGGVKAGTNITIDANGTISGVSTGTSLGTMNVANVVSIVDNPVFANTIRTIPSRQTSLVFGNNRWVAVPDNGMSATAISTTAGVSWVAGGSLPFGSYWTGIAYGNGLFVAVAGITANGVATSPDGVTWTQRTDPVGTASWSSITFGNGRFVAVARGASSTSVMYSNDGITWTAATNAITNCLAVTYGNGLFVAVQDGNAAATSPDGITWTSRTLPSSASWNDVTYGNGVFVTVASSGAKAATSSDGINWAARTLPSASAWASVAYESGLFVATAPSGSTATISEDNGVTWTVLTLPAVSGNIASIAGSNGGGYFVALAPNTQAITIGLTFGNTTTTITGNTVLASTTATSATVSGNTAVSNLTATGNVTLGNVANVHIAGGTSGQFLQTDGNGNLSWSNPASNTSLLITSNITSLTAGYQIRVGYSANATYPSGVWTIYQTPPPSTTMSAVWVTSSSNTKDAYSGVTGPSTGTPVTSAANVTLGVTGDTFNISSGDYILIGSSNITGAALTALNITGTGGTYSIAAGNISNANSFTQTTVPVTGALTTVLNGRVSFTGGNLTNQQPVPFSIASVTGAFPNSVVPYWLNSQMFNWNVNSVNGTVSSGTVTLSGTNSATLTSVGALSGSSANYTSNSGVYTLSANFVGTGTHGYVVTNNSNVSGTVNTATVYYPLFYKTTGSSTNPFFATTDQHLTSNFALGQGAYTTSDPNNYLWIAIPATYTGTLTFKHDDPPFNGIVDTPANIYLNQDVGGQLYNVYGFNLFSAVRLIYTTA